MKKHKKIFLSPHSDDETLFGFYTLLKEKPLVIICTDSYIQFIRGENITAEQRIEETKNAMKIAECDVEFLGIKDSEITEELLEQKLLEYDAEIVYAPSVEEGGNDIHNMVGNIANKLFKNVVPYKTYTKDTTRSKGSVYIIPSDEYRNKKEQALKMYPSQTGMSNKAYFEDKDILNWEAYE